MSIFLKFYLYLFFITTLFSFEQGRVVNTEIIEYESLEQIQSNIINELGNVGIVSQYGATIYRILYETLDGYGDSTVASGVFAVPDSEQEAFGIVSWQHGTQIERQSAQSNRGFDILSRAVSSSGFIFVASDYIGLGISNDIHPYILKEPSASSVIDLIRAIRSYFDEDISICLNRQLFLIGYSEGGYVTLAAQEAMENDFEDEFEITISFPMAGPYDLSGTMVNKMLEDDIYGEPFYLPYLLYAYITYYPNMGSVQEYFSTDFALVVDDQYSGIYGSGYLNDYMNENSYNPPKLSLNSGIVSDFESNPNHILRLALQENDLHDWAPKSKTYLFHAIADELIPYQNSVESFNRFIDNGSQDVFLELLPESYGGHQEAAPYAILTAFSTMQEFQLINPIGDVNHDGSIDIIDVINIVNIILDRESIQLDSYLVWASDINKDSAINIYDIIQLVGIIYFQE